jgi:DNA-binding NarL/FixJ family response regulator
MGETTFCAAVAAEFAGDETTTQSAYEHMLALGQETGNAHLVGNALFGLGDAAYRAGHFAKAHTLSTESIAWLERAGDLYTVGIAQGTLGWLALAAGDQTGAKQLAASSLRSALAFDAPWIVANALALVAGVALAAGDSSGAARLLGAADAGRVLAGSVTFYHHGQYVDLVTRVRAALGPQTFAAAAAEGSRLALSDAATEAWAVLRGESAIGAPHARDLSGSKGDLSPREVEVLGLLARGRSDQQIADELFISYRTATTHVRNILGKLGVDNRTAAAAEPVRRGLA